MFRKALIVAAAALLGSCVYFNTFYNAKQKFSEAERNQSRSEQSGQKKSDIDFNRAGVPQEPTISLNDKTLYKAAIDKANKVAIYHPNSKYADDALWMIGKARYNMTEFTSSDKKLRELVVRFPESKYVDDGYFYIGMSQFWLRSYDLAREAFGDVVRMKKSSYKDDAAFMLGYIDYVEENYASSASTLGDFLKEYGGSDSAATGQFFIGVCFDSLGKRVEAIREYDKVGKFNPSHDLYYDAQFACGTAAFKADSVNLGMSIFENLARQERYFEKSSKIRLKLAEGMHLLGQTDDAITAYLKVIEQFPKTNQSGEAYYRLGLIYQDTKDDMEKAQEYFNNATKEKRDSPFYGQALAKSAQISKFQTYLKKLGRGLPGQEIDSARADSASGASGVVDSVRVDSTRLAEYASLDTPAPETLQAVPGPDSAGATAPAGEVRKSFLELMLEEHMGERAVGDEGLPVEAGQNLGEQWSGAQPETVAANTQTQVADSLTDSLSADSENVKIRFLLAELYHHDLNRPDSAIHEYLLLADAYPLSEYAPMALLAAAFIYQERGDSLSALRQYRRLIEQYPSSAQARYAVSKIEGAELPVQLDVARLYEQAHELYFTYDDADSAMALLDFIERRFPQSEYAPKAAFARAWITSQRINDGDSTAYYAFASVADKYPDTRFAEEAKIMMGLVKKPTAQEANPTRAPEGAQGGAAQSDSASRATQDSLLNVANTLPMAPAVKDTGDFLYPETLLGRKRVIVVTFKIKLDLFGNVTAHELLGPSGNREIDSLATEALLETTFDISTLEDVSLLNDYFRYDKRIQPPEYNDFRNDPDNPYEEREERVQ